MTQPDITPGEIMTTAGDDLSEWGERLGKSRDDFLAILGYYDTNGHILVREVVSRLHRLADPPGYHARAAVKAAEELELAIENFGNLRINLMVDAGFVGFAATGVVDSLQLKYLASLGKVSFRIEPGQAPGEAAQRHIQDLKETSERSVTETSAIARLVAAQAIDAFNAATDVVQLRMFSLVKFLDATNPPESVTSSEGKSYEIGAVRDAAATETIFLAGEEALKRIGVEVVGQVPVVSIVASLAKIILDVRKEIKHFNERQALWARIIDDPYRRNVAEEALDFADYVREDDEAIHKMSESLADEARQLMEMSRYLLKS
jgi:hypothetical protein